MADEATLSAGLAQVLSGLAKAEREEALVLLQELLAAGHLAPAMEALAALDGERFHLFAVRPMEKIIAALGTSTLGPNSPAMFLFTHYRFVERNFCELYRTYEGSACCADKSRWAMRALANHFVDEAPIQVDLTQEYTFHLPRKILNTQESLTQMFTALQRLHYGRPEQYLAAMAALSHIPKEED